jgi:hypothetical protein
VGDVLVMARSDAAASLAIVEFVTIGFRDFAATSVADLDPVLCVTAFNFHGFYLLYASDGVTCRIILRVGWISFLRLGEPSGCLWRLGLARMCGPWMGQ